MSLRRRLGALLLLAASTLVFFAGAASAQSDATGDDGVALVLQAAGLLDPIVAGYLVDNIEQAPANDVVVIVLNVDSRGSVLDDDRFAELAATIRDAAVPVGMWVGPNQEALGAWVDLASQVDRLAVAPGARFGDAPQQSRLGAGFDLSRFTDVRSTITGDTIDADQAAALGISDIEAPTLGSFLVGMTDLGVVTELTDDGTTLRTVGRLAPPDLVQQQFHTFASPPVAYLLFTIGLALLVFEFYTAGVGVAGVVGAVMFVLGSYGVWMLPTRWWAVALLVVAMFAFSIDVQTGVPRFWSGVGALALAIATIFLFRDPASMSWIPMLVGIVGISVMMVSGMPTMVRTRFSTPTIGREWMIGSDGVAVDAIDPDGVVRIDGALWRARTNRATPIDAGGAVRVAAVEGLLLEVEPPEGAARDYRERRRSSDN